MSASRTAAAPPGTEAGEEALLERAEVRDVLAWMRLLVDPHDAAAVVRALARPPIELRQVHLARVIQLARRRRMDLVAGVAWAIESPQVPPEARERIQRFIELHRRAAAGLDTLGPEVFVVTLMDILGARGRMLLAPDAAVERRESLEGLREIAVQFARRRPGSTPRELAAHLSAAAPRAPRGITGAPRARAWESPGSAAAAAGEHGGPPKQGLPAVEPREEITAARSERPREPAARHAPEAAPEGDSEARLQEALQRMREEVLTSISRLGGRLGELRLDTELDVAHGVVRYLELLKLSALLQRPAGEDMAEALAELNARLAAAATPLQREILETSPLDSELLGSAAPRLGELEEHSLGPFLPRRGGGLALSASDIETYRSCPLRYKYSRVLRIPVEQTLHQRFGIVVHQVLERFHGEGEQTLARVLELLDTGWRRAGLGDSEHELELRHKARAALVRYHERLHDERAEPVWFERSFAFRLGPHHVRGRVDRVDRLADGAADVGYELIDYKTSRPKAPAELRDDVQLSLYALAASEDWHLASSRQAYYYVLDDRKVPVPCEERDAEWLKDLVLAVGEGILAERFEATPSPAACSLCGYRITCPVAQA